MSELSKLKAEVASLGGALVDEKIGESHTCSVEAPRGFVWAGSGIHEMTDTAYRPWTPDYRDLRDRVSYGLEPCEVTGCEWCNDNPDEETP